MLWFPVYAMQWMIYSEVFNSLVNGVVFFFFLLMWTTGGITSAFREPLSEDQAFQLYVQL